MFIYNFEGNIVISQKIYIFFNLFSFFSLFQNIGFFKDVFVNTSTKTIKAKCLISMSKLKTIIRWINEVGEALFARKKLFASIDI